MLGLQGTKVTGFGVQGIRRRGCGTIQVEGDERCAIAETNG
jgi:hypothetical protein